MIATIERINEILINPIINTGHINELNTLFHGLKNELGLHGELNPAALNSLYKIIDQTCLTDQAKEHVVWFYYEKRIRTTPADEMDQVIENLIGDFKKYTFYALESVMINLLRSDTVPYHCLDGIQQTFNSKETKKYILIAELKKKIEGGDRLSTYDIKELLKHEAYDFIISILDQRVLQSDMRMLELFTDPLLGEKNRKKKKAIYDKAKSVLR